MGCQNPEDIQVLITGGHSIHDLHVQLSRLSAHALTAGLHCKQSPFPVPMSCVWFPKAVLGLPAGQHKVPPAQSVFKSFFKTSAVFVVKENLLTCLSVTEQWGNFSCYSLSRLSLKKKNTASRERASKLASTYKLYKKVVYTLTKSSQGEIKDEVWGCRCILFAQENEDNRAVFISFLFSVMIHDFAYCSS